MLASFFRVALRVTDGVPAAAKDRADILAYYTGHSGEGGNVSDWLAIAKQWTDGGSCGSGYYANNIAMMPMYDLARLEDDVARKQTIRSEILGTKMWPAFAKTKNSFFSFIYAANTSAFDPAVVTSAAAQLASSPLRRAWRARSTSAAHRNTRAAREAAPTRSAMPRRSTSAIAARLTSCGSGILGVCSTPATRSRPSREWTSWSPISWASAMAS